MGAGYNGCMHRESDPFNLGQSYFYGAGGRPNYKKAFPLLLSAAKDGYPHAQNLIGFSLDSGLGVRRDPATRRSRGARRRGRGSR